MGRKVNVLGVGMVKFQKPGASDGYEVMAHGAITVLRRTQMPINMVARSVRVAKSVRVARRARSGTLRLRRSRAVLRRPR